MAEKTKHSISDRRRKSTIIIVLILPFILYAIISMMCAHHRDSEATRIFIDNMPNIPFQFNGLDNQKYITTNIEPLQTIQINGKDYPITWSSDAPQYVTSDGVVNRPTDSNKDVVMTASIQYGRGIGQIEYKIRVIKSSVLNSNEIDVIDLNQANDNVRVVYNDDVVCAIYGNFKQTIQSETDAHSVLMAHSDVFQIPLNSELKCINIQQSLLGTVYSYKQYHMGLEVVGSYAIVSTTGDTLSSINVHLDRSLTDKEYKSVKDETIKDLLKANGTVISIEQKILDDKSIYVVRLAKDNGVVSVLIDAETLKSVHRNMSYGANDENDLMIGHGTDGFEHGQLLGVNAVQSEQTYLCDSKRRIQVIDHDCTFNDFENDDLDKILAQMSILPWGCGIPIHVDEFDKTIDFTPISSNNGIFDNSLAIASYNNLIAAYDWYERVLGRSSYDGKGGDVKCIVGSVFAKNNAAYWASINAFVFGETNCYDHPLGTFLDIVGHEYAHAVFESIAGSADYQTGMTSGIDEGYADIFGCLIEGDWIIADGIVEGKAIRNPTDIEVDLDSNTKWPEYYLDDNWSDRNGYPNSILLTRAAYKMSQQGFSNEDIAKIWYQSMFYGYGDDSDFISVRNNVMQAAILLGNSDERVETINKIFDELKIGESK